MSLKLGKRPASVFRPKLKFAKYLDFSILPTPPNQFGYTSLVTSPWGMLGNDSVGDCVEAGAGHETMLWNAEAGVQVPFTDASVISDYSSATGYVPGNTSTDQGTDMVAYAHYRQTTGILDANGKRHMIGAYADLTPGNLQELVTAMWLFQAVGVGWALPQSAMDQFGSHPWTYVKGSPIIGGHYTPAVMKQNRANGAWGIGVVTWGALQEVGDGFTKAYMDEGLVYFSSEFLVNNRSVNGFDKDQLLADLQKL